MQAEGETNPGKIRIEGLTAVLPDFAMNDRVIVWFSCGAASAVVAFESLKQFPNVLIVNCDTRPNEHPDNYRFCSDCEKWWGKKIIHIRSEDYATIDEVFEKTNYMAGTKGARCTTELKKIPRLNFAYPDDIHVFGFTAEETKRVGEFEKRNPDMRLRWVLIELGITKVRCYQALQKAGIQLPKMYGLGFDNNNCIGCVKASSPWYWDRIREHFPLVFERRSAQSRKLGVRLVQLHHHERIYLDELPPGPFRKGNERISCGPECGQAILNFETSHKENLGLTAATP